MIKLKDFLNEVEVKLGKEIPRAFQSKLEDYLDNWLVESDPSSAEWLYKNFDTFKKLKSKYPDIIAPKFPNGTLLYRGLTNPNKELVEQVIKDKSNKEMFEKVMIGGKVWYKYKKKVKYSPRLICQSWTQEAEIASGYIDDDMKFILQTKQDDNFLFNSDFLGGRYDFNKELIHFGKEFPKGIYLLVKWK